MSVGFRALAAVSAGVVLLIAFGCRDQRVSEENDRLRARILDVEAENRSLRQRNAELQRALERADDALGKATADELAATPRLVNLEIGRLSHFDDDDGDGMADTLVLYVHPRDGRERFLQIVGTLTVHAAVLPPDTDAETIGRMTLGPIELRDAYRSGMTGTHYTVEMPIERTIARDATARAATIIVNIEFTEARTGQVFTAARSVPLHR
jgi:hypothetical protein